MTPSIALIQRKNKVSHKEALRLKKIELDAAWKKVLERKKKGI